MLDGLTKNNVTFGAKPAFHSLSPSVQGNLHSILLLLMGCILLERN